MVRIKTLEKILKDYGFTVPPQPPTKTKMGKPGAGQAAPVIQLYVFHIAQS